MTKHSATITDEFIRQSIADGKQYFLVLLKAGPRRDQEPAAQERLQQEHLRHLFQLRAEGSLVLNGPILEDPQLLGLSIFNLTDKEEARTLVEADPAVKAGRLTYEIYPWFGLPGDSLPRT